MDKLILHFILNYSNVPLAPLISFLHLFYAINIVYIYVYIYIQYDFIYIFCIELAAACCVSMYLKPVVRVL